MLKWSMLSLIITDDMLAGNLEIILIYPLEHIIKVDFCFNYTQFVV